MIYPVWASFVLWLCFFALAWRYETASKVISRLLPLAIAACFIPIIFGIGAIISAFYIGGVEIAEQAVKSWAMWGGAWIGSIAGLYTWLWAIVILAACVHGCVRALMYLMLPTATKKKGIPQSLGDRLELHDDDNPFIDLRFHPETDNDTHSLLRGRSQP